MSKTGKALTLFTVLAFISCSSNPPNLSPVNKTNGFVYHRNINKDIKKPSTNPVNNTTPYHIGKGTFGIKQTYGAPDPQACNPVNNRYDLRVYNTDDYSSVYINDNLTANNYYSEDSGLIDITDRIHNGDNLVRFNTYNYGGPYNWGFSILKNGQIIFDEHQGQAGVTGANNNDLSKEYQDVYDKTFTITESCTSNPPSTIQETCTTEHDSSGNAYENCFTCPPGSSPVIENGIPVKCEFSGTPTEEEYVNTENTYAPFGVKGFYRFEHTYNSCSISNPN